MIFGYAGYTWLQQLQVFNTPYLLCKIEYEAIKYSYN